MHCINKIFTTKRNFLNIRENHKRDSLELMPWIYNLSEQ